MNTTIVRDMKEAEDSAMNMEKDWLIKKKGSENQQDGSGVRSS